MNTMEILITVSVALLAGLLMTRVAKPLGLPAVTAYLVTGILLGPYVLGRLNIAGLGFPSFESVESFELLSKSALGFIAFMIGNEFRLSQLKKTGKKATVLSFCEALSAAFLVTACLIALHFIMPDKISLPAAIALGAVATATAPAATLMVVKQYKAKGELVDLLLPIVALDDAIALVVFSVASGVARAIQSSSFSFAAVCVSPLLDVIFSLLLGAVMGFLFSFTQRFFKSRSKRLSVSVTFVLLTVALSMIKFNLFGMEIEFSPLLVCMMLGTVFCNVCDFSEELMERIDRWTAPVIILFFVLSGAELDLGVFTDIAVVGIGAVYIISRSIGKYSGAGIGARALKCPDSVSKYLGITLLPQAGVALGMTITATELLGETDGGLIRNITLFSVLIYELVGPLLTKIALTKAGNIHPKEDDGPLKPPVKQ